MGSLDTKNKINLCGDEALKLWRTSANGWNKWVNKNPEANIDFSNFNFSQLPEDIISFERFRFPRGNIIFSGAYFGSKKVSFRKAVFSEGKVCFDNATFGIDKSQIVRSEDGDMWLSLDELKDIIEPLEPEVIHVNFSYVNFNDCIVTFNRAKFIGRIARFDHAYFQGKRLTFNTLQATDSKIYFENTVFNSSRAANEASLLSLNNLEFKRSHLSLKRGMINVDQFSLCDSQFTAESFEDKGLDISEAVLLGKYFSLKRTSIHNGGISFSESILVFPYCSFENLSATNSPIIFDSVSFEVSNISFEQMVSNNCSVYFNNSHFTGNLSFEDSTLSSTTIQFHEVKIKSDTLTFVSTKFFNSNASFFKSTFNVKHICFSQLSIDNSLLDFFAVQFIGHTDFNDLELRGKTRSLSFKGAKFNNVFEISSFDVFTPVLDLTHSTITRHFPVVNIHCAFNKENSLFFFDKSSDQRDVARIQRLKEISESCKDHRKSLEFHALEQKARRWNEKTSKMSLTLDYTFDILSNYGQSTTRPTVSLFLTWLIFIFLYLGWSDLPISLKNLEPASILSASQIFPLFPNSKEAQKQALLTLFGESFDMVLFTLVTLENILALIFIFLIGLALRNRFKI